MYPPRKGRGRVDEVKEGKMLTIKVKALSWSRGKKTVAYSTSRWRTLEKKPKGKRDAAIEKEEDQSMKEKKIRRRLRKG